LEVALDVAPLLQSERWGGSGPLPLARGRVEDQRRAGPTQQVAAGLKRQLTKPRRRRTELEGQVSRTGV